MRQTRLVRATPDRISRLGKRSDEHKYDHGHCLVISGPSPRSGAARLAAMAALRVGTGLVTIGARGDALQHCAAQMNAVMVHEISDGASLARFLRIERRITSICIGPGLGTDIAAAEMVQAALESKRSCVVDADALTLLAGSDDMQDMLHMRCLLTPHGGEFKRMFPDYSVASTHEMSSKASAVWAAAQSMGCTVAFKGARTVLATPAGDSTALDLTGEAAVPWLATAGSGDVYAGICAGLLARGLSPFEAGGTGALIHAEAARKTGPGLISEDIAPQIPAVFADWGL